MQKLGEMNNDRGRGKWEKGAEGACEELLAPPEQNPALRFGSFPHSYSTFPLMD